MAEVVKFDVVINDEIQSEIVAAPHKRCRQTWNRKTTKESKCGKTRAAEPESSQNGPSDEEMKQHLISEPKSNGKNGPTDDKKEVDMSNGQDILFEENETESNTQVAYVQALCQHQSIAPVDENFMAFIVQDYDLAKSCLLDGFVIIKRKVVKTPKELTSILYGCTCNPARQRLIDTLSATLPDELPDDLDVPYQKCYHIKALESIVGQYDKKTGFCMKKAFENENKPDDGLEDHSYDKSKPQTKVYGLENNQHVVCVRLQEEGQQPTYNIISINFKGKEPTLVCDCKNKNCDHIKAVQNHGDSSYAESILKALQVKNEWRQRYVPLAVSTKLIPFSVLPEEQKRNRFDLTSMTKDEDGAIQLIPGPEGQCSCGQAWGDEQCLENVKIYTDVDILPAKAYIRRCSNTSCQKWKEYDGGNDQVLFMGSYLVTNQVLRSYLMQFVTEGLFAVVIKIVCLLFAKLLVNSDIKMGMAASRQEAFWEACGFGHTDRVHKFLSEGDVDVNWVSYTHDCSPIHVASQGKPEIVEMLINAKCNVNAKDIRGNLALHHAAMKGHANIIQMLIDAGSEVNTQDKNGWTPLHCAGYWSHGNVVQVLLKNGASINVQNKDQRTALHETARSQEPREAELGEIARMLVDAGSDINVKSSDLGLADLTGLMYAAYHNHPEVASVLIEAGCELDAVGSTFWTALHWAVDRENDEIVYLLLEAGVDPTKRGMRGELAVDRAKSTEITEILMNATNMYKELAALGSGDITTNIPTKPQVSLKDINNEINKRSANLKTHLLLKSGSRQERKATTQSLYNKEKENQLDGKGDNPQLQIETGVKEKRNNQKLQSVKKSVQEKGDNELSKTAIAVNDNADRYVQDKKGDNLQLQREKICANDNPNSTDNASLDEDSVDIELRDCVKMEKDHASLDRDGVDVEMRDRVKNMENDKASFDRDGVDLEVRDCVKMEKDNVQLDRDNVDIIKKPFKIKDGDACFEKCNVDVGTREHGKSGGEIEEITVSDKDADTRETVTSEDETGDKDVDIMARDMKSLHVDGRTEAHFEVTEN